MESNVRKKNRIAGIVAFFIPLLVLFLACGKDEDKTNENTFQYASFRNIPGVTADEINAIEELQKKNVSLVYGTPFSTEAFIDEEGEIGGFAVLLCDWLTDLFNIRFRPEIHNLSDILEKMKSGDVSFSALTASEDRLKIYYMTAPVIHRSTKVMRIKGRPSPGEIVLSRPVRYLFMEGTTLIDTVTSALAPGSYEVITARDHDIIYQMLMRDEADVYIANNIVESAFDSYGGIVTEDFLPLIITPVSLTAQDPNLAPVISVITKVLDCGAYKYMTEIYRQGYYDYKKNYFLIQLSDEERAYVRNTPEIPFAAQFMSYPVSFYNTNSGKWEGVIFDVLDEMEKLTGFKFRLVNDEKTELPELMNLLENGTAYIMPNLIQSDERRQRFIWPNTTYLSDRFALLSKRSYPNIELNDIPFARIGFAKGSAFGDLFQSWFPDALYAIEYPGTDDAFFALERGELDLVMSSQSRLTALTNYYEFSDYKANYLFSADFDASFGLNKDQTVLCSIIDKALPLIDTIRIAEQWTSRTYNIETMRLKEQRPWLFGSLILILCVLVLLAVLFERSRRAGKRLESVVTDRTRELALQTAKLQAVFDSLPDIVFCKDLNLRYTQCNKVSEEYTGVKEADVAGKNDIETSIFPAIVAKRIMELDRIALEECRKIVVEETMPYHDGFLRTLETIRSPLVQNGVMTGLIVIARDITDRKKVERELELQTATLTTLFDSIPDLIFTKDLHLNFLQCNKSFLEYFNRRKEDVIGKIDNDAFGLDYETAEKFLKWDRRVIGENRTFTIEEPLPRFDGTEPLYETIKSPLVLDGEVIGLLAIARDITERKKVERELELQTAVLTTLFDSIPDFIFTKDVNFCYMQCNKSYLAHLGFSKEDVIGKNDVEGFKLDPELVEEYWVWDRKVINECRRIMLEERIPGADGTNPLYETVKAPLVLDGKVIGLLGISRDITMRKEMEEAALLASQSKSAFLANMSHEIRTPMNSIMGFSELALDGEASPKTRDYLFKIQTNAEWLLQIINDILDISKIESGKMELENIPFNMHELFTSCRTLIMPKAVEKGIDLRFYAEPSIGKIPLGDPTRLRQVLVNLLSNAVKFTNAGMVKVIAEIKGKTDKSVTVLFEIKDSGIGMTSEQIEKIFDPFTQAETGTTRQYGGTGLGLSITKNIVELMGGKLSVESALGIGSKFSFTLTFDTIDAENDNTVNQKAAFKKIDKPFFDGEVLLCEDNAMNQQVICEHLTRVGLRTVIADNGKIGLKMVKTRMEKGEKQFDLIFMDMHMPVMDGLEASAKIIELGTGIPIVAMTANIMSSDLDIYKQSGMSDCVGKPFTSQELWGCLLKYLKPVSGSSAARKNIQNKEDLSDFDLEFKKSLQKTFLKNNQEKFKEIMTALDCGDIKLAHRLVHTMKGNAGQLGKTALQKAAADVEFNLKDGKNFVSRERLAIFKMELDAALSELAAEAASFDEDAQEPAQVRTHDAQSARELLERLEPMLMMGNPECCGLVESLRGIDGSGELIRKIEDYEFESALASLDDLKKKLE